jgi:hypothetical protein
MSEIAQRAQLETQTRRSTSQPHLDRRVYSLNFACITGKQDTLVLLSTVLLVMSVIEHKKWQNQYELSKVFFFEHNDD